MDLLRRFKQILQRSSRLTMYKTFIRSQLDFADIIYDQAYSSSLRISSIQCFPKNNRSNKGTSSETLYQELELESLKSRRSFRQLCHFYKILNEKAPL